jgi:hypothetical protein
MSAVTEGNIEISASNAYIFTNTSNYDMVVYTTACNQRILLGTQCNSIAPVIIDSNASVVTSLAVGKCNPTATLDVSGTINLTGGAMSVSNAMFTYGVSTFCNTLVTASNLVTLAPVSLCNTVTATNNAYFMGPVGINTSNPLDYLTIAASNFSISNFGRTMIFASNNNLGLGTQNPLTLLHVNGNTTIGGNLTLNAPFQTRTLQIIKNTTGLPPNFASYNAPGVSYNSGSLYVSTPGSNSSDFLAFVTGSNPNSEKMRITGGGAIGIGTQNPGSTLEVNGTVTANNTLSTGNGTGAANFYMNDINGARWWLNTSGFLLTFYNDTGGTFTSKFSIGNNGNVTIGSKLIVGSGGQSIGSSYTGVTPPTNGLITQGNVGIGKSNPAYLLDVAGIINASSLYVGGAPYIGSQWSNTSSNVFLIGSNVGIGTSSPSAPLVVQTNAGTGGFKIIANSTNAGDQWWLGYGHGGGSTDANDRARIGVNIVAGGAGRLFFTTGLAGAQTERMRIDESGNVGIGISSPSYVLDVNGTVNVNKGLTTNNKLLVLYDLGSSDSLATACNFYGFGVNGNTLRYQVPDNQKHQWYGGTTAMMTLTNSSLGIGTTTPAYKLEVNGMIGTNLNSICFQPSAGSITTDGTYGIYWHTSNDLNYAIYRSSGAWTATTYQQLVMSFITGIVLNPGSLYTKSYVDIQGGGLRVTAGTVGIGTTSPSESIQSTNKIYSQVQLLGTSNDSATVPSYSFKENSNTGMFHPLNNMVGFSTGGTERVRINDSGNVGIGKSNPTYPLDVAGIINATSLYVGGAPYIGSQWSNTSSSVFLLGSNVGIGTSSPGNPLTVISTSTTVIPLSVTGSGINGGGSPVAQFLNSNATPVILFGSAPASNLYINYTSNTNTAQLGLYNGNITMSVTSNYVGIGTSTPTAPLTLSSLSGRVALLQGTSNTGSCYMQFSNSTPSTAYIGLDGFGYGNLSSGAFLMSTWNAYPILFATSNQERMRITSAGYVGIGTTSPAVPLHVICNTTNFQSPAATNGVYLRLDASPSTSGKKYLIGSSATGNGTTGCLEFYDETAGALRMVINTSGNVGIGTSSPAYQLDVAGTINATVASSGIAIQGLNSALTSGQFIHSVLGQSTTSSNCGVIKYTHNSAGGLNYVQFGIWGQNNITCAANGNVGIRASTPSSTLDVNGQITLGNDSGWLSGGIRFRSANGTVDAAIVQGNNGYIYFRSPANDGAGGYQWLNAGGASSLMTLSNNGNLGIGTSSPAQKLDVVGGVNITNGSGNTGATTGLTINTAVGTDGTTTESLILQQGTNNASSRQAVTWRNTLNNNYTMARIWSQVGGGYTNTMLGFDVADSSRNIQTRAVIDVNGNMGIGTTSPGYKLHVAGDIYMDRIYLNDGYWLARQGYDLTYNWDGYPSIVSYTRTGEFRVHGNGAYVCAIRCDGGYLSFTGCHESFRILPETCIGLIVIANGRHITETKDGIFLDQITVMDALPVIDICTKKKDKRVYGVLSEIKYHNNETNRSIKKSCKVNSIGEGGIWVTNVNGYLENGDYITTSDVHGYGEKQDECFICNYTVAKITQDCDFNPQLVLRRKALMTDNHVHYDESGHLLEESYKDENGQEIYDLEYPIRYVRKDGSILSKEEYDASLEDVYIAAFVGCTYHCG